MSIKQSISKQTKIEGHKRNIRTYIRSQGCYVFVHEHPKWDIYTNSREEEDTYAYSSVDFNCFENAAIWKMLKGFVLNGEFEEDE